jgi:hypothetical protein
VEPALFELRFSQLLPRTPRWFQAQFRGADGKSAVSFCWFSTGHSTRLIYWLAPHPGDGLSRSLKIEALTLKRLKAMAIEFIAPAKTVPASHLLPAT